MYKAYEQDAFILYIRVEDIHTCINNMVPGCKIGVCDYSRDRMYVG